MNALSIDLENHAVTSWPSAPCCRTHRHARRARSAFRNGRTQRSRPSVWAARCSISAFQAAIEASSTQKELVNPKPSAPRVVSTPRKPGCLGCQFHHPVRHGGRSRRRRRSAWRRRRDHVGRFRWAAAKSVRSLSFFGGQISEKCGACVPVVQGKLRRIRRGIGGFAWVSRGLPQASVCV